MKKSIWKQCTSKRRYRDEHTANHYRKMFQRERGKALDYYWCVYCKGYHLTSTESFLAEKWEMIVNSTNYLKAEA